MKHLPECRVETLEERASEFGHDVPDELKGQFGFRICAEGCPYLARVQAYAKELAEERGW